MFYNHDYSIDIYNDDVKKNTWEDWHLIPKERPSIAPPEVKTEYVDIPGANGSLDYTEVLAGEPRYGNRKGSWDFIVENGHQNWYSLYNELLTFLHGRRFNCVLKEEPNYVYSGRFDINQWKSEERYSTITINYNLDPYKTMSNGVTMDWLWDDLTFDSDVYTIYYGTFSVSDYILRNFYNPLDHEVELSFTISDTMTVWWDYSNPDTLEDFIHSQTFNAGTYEHTGIMLAPATSDLEGNNIFKFEGTGTVIINYERGANSI